MAILESFGAWLVRALALLLFGAWTTPSTYTTGQMMSASILNAQLTNNLLVLKTCIDNNGGVFVTPVYTAIAGPLDNWNPGLVGNSVLFCSNTTLLQINGLANGEDGQQLTIVAEGAGNVGVTQEDTADTAANRLTNLSSGILPIGSGSFPVMTLVGGSGTALYVYSATLARWRMTAFEQGGWIPYTSAWTASGTAPAIGNGTIAAAYWQKGHTISFRIVVTFGSTSTYGTGVWSFALPCLPQSNGTCACVLNTTAGAWSAVAALTASVGVTVIYESHGGASTGIGPTSPATWVSGNTLTIQGSYETL